MPVGLGIGASRWASHPYLLASRRVIPCLVPCPTLIPLDARGGGAGGGGDAEGGFGSSYCSGVCVGLASALAWLAVTFLLVFGCLADVDDWLLFSRLLGPFSRRVFSRSRLCSDVRTVSEHVVLTAL